MPGVHLKQAGISYPDRFCLYGPNTNLVVNVSVAFFGECSVRYDEFFSICWRRSRALTSMMSITNGEMRPIARWPRACRRFLTGTRARVAESVRIGRPRLWGIGNGPWSPTPRILSF